MEHDSMPTRKREFVGCSPLVCHRLPTHLSPEQNEKGASIGLIELMRHRLHSQHLFAHVPSFHASAIDVNAFRAITKRFRA